GGNGGTSDSSMYNVVVRAGSGGGGGVFTVTVDSVSTGKAYTANATAKAGALHYIDRSYTVTSLGGALAGGVLIRTANDDKSVTANPHLRFSVNVSATVWVCYDKRGTQVPAWLNDGTWTVTVEDFSVSDGGASPMRVYRKSVPAGQVSLGGNLSSPATGAGSHYVVIVKAANQ
ncbi:MAG TPA: hypothetical protein VJB14_06705, partial [Planctomycetota bacterium]|nr:hypothetical protein [Planctomycetota bacterium]